MINIALDMMKSYKSDSGLFKTETDTDFPKRNTNFEELKILREIFFPNYWGCGSITNDKTKAENKINELKIILTNNLSIYFDEKQTNKMVESLINGLPAMRDVLKKDVEAAYAGDPSAKDYTEIIRCFPGFAAIMIQRFAHEIYELRGESYARELTELGHSLTGIDIHPGAKIGEHFFIDHGTGVVIGETCEIGKWVRLYQGVTLGVLHFEKEENTQGILKKNYKRHPTIGSHVVIGAGAKILGPITVGSHVNVGANSWIQEDVPDDTTVYITEHPKLQKKERKK